MAEAIGTQYFRQVVITWSIRSRGSVQRSQIMHVTPKTALAMKLLMPNRLPIQPSTVCGSPPSPSHEAIGTGPFHPPRKSNEPSPLTTNIAGTRP